MKASFGPLWVVLMTTGLPVAAQPMDRKPLRDPTQTPAAARLSAPTGNVDRAHNPTRTPHHIVVANGRAYVIDRGRRLSVGQLLGTARIERIDDSAVWLREAGVVRRIKLYPGISKRAVVRDGAIQGQPSHRQQSNSKKDQPS